ncbi:small guanosine triphosphatase family Ras-related in brain (Rab) family protein, putative (macronuclear) [Tetrahymena thermophila SB210]|uniref:Small guanosine triphosphatase family Ras-related in brain (Rab) family protein, putative n=1 Tax=Tetrahymena thermophila (strain SB210) TaxID=312017 RepID=Q23MD0_TETTS|nr:small guanosine triphosphatase family Ras-related in brain (Rab) family protein, putative [Tetrahymena thermophila SB210]EAR97709.2 small guanosine triphosphatase family Ras-related in brain (Rab) family protein, putative [Tetrahymena thermophila SB210]|eukprot:XP_001017954.2 small guanosine triphosphatase family Ras-related in brain (Rab) family protein, putative [Tetrahymena thermophila SB210]
MLDCNYLNQYSIQTILIGKQSCGKTTLIETLSGHLNKGLSQYWSSKEFGVSNIDLQFQEFVTEEIDERFILEISQSDYPIIVILTFDINDPSSFDEIVNNYCIMQMLKTIGVSQGRFILLGAKHDLKNEVQDQEISHFLSSQQYNLSYQCVSAKNNKGIKELKQSLFNLAKQQIAQIIPNTSTGSKWQSMDEKLDESYWTSNQSYNSQNRHVKIADRRSKEIPQIEEVMNILNSYKNNYFDNQLDSSYQHEEQSLSSQYEEYTETQSSQSEKLHNEHINSKVSQYGIECKQELEEQQENFYDLMNKKEEYQQVNDLEQEEIQDNTIKQICQNPLEKQQMINVSKQIYEDVDSQHQNCSPRTVNQSKQQIVCELKHELIQKQQTDLDRYFEQIGRKAQSVNKFNTINSNSSISSSYSRIYDNNKKNNIQNSHRSQQTQLVDNHDSSCNSEKWEIGVLEQIDESCQNKSQQNNQILEDKIKQQNHLYPKKVQQSSVMSETGRNLQTSYDKKNEKIYANPLNNLTNRERSNFYQINQSEIEKDSQDESLQIDDQKNNLFSEMSSCQINQIHFHQIHSHKQHKVTQSLYSEKENSFENIFQKQRNQTELNKSQIYQVKINLEKSSKNDKIVFQEIQNYNNKSIKSVKKSITKKDQESSSNKSEKENFSKKQDKKNEPNSFQKKKNTKYLMSLCLQFQDQQIYIDVLENESSFDIAHQFCKKANILPTINQIKKCQKIIQQQIEEYTQNLDRKLESIERKVLEQKEEKFESLMNQFLKENKNFLMDVNNPDVYDSNFKLISKLNQNLLQNNLTKTTNLFNQQNKTKTPTKTPTKSPSRTPKITPTKVPKTNLYVRSKSPTPLFKSTCKI